MLNSHRAFRWLPTIVCLLICCPVLLVGQAGQSTNISVIDGDTQFRCQSDSLVQFLVQVKDSFPVERISVSLPGVDTLTPIDPAGNLTFSHPFPGPETDTDCEYPNACILEEFYGFCYLVRVTVVYDRPDNLDPRETNSVDVVLTAEPRPAFEVEPAVICSGEAITIRNTSCFLNAPDRAFAWVLDGDTISRETDLTFPDGLPPGDYSLTLRDSNRCGQVPAPRTLTIQERPEADAIPEGAGVEGENSPYRICVDGRTCFTLDGTGTVGADRYRWELLSGGTIGSIRDRDSSRTEVCIDQPPATTPLEFRLTATNTACGLTSVDTFTVNAVPVESLSVGQQRNECQSLSYLPGPGVDSTATYFLDGSEIPIDAFPLDLQARAEPYIITAEKDTECGPLIDSDTFSVSPPIQPVLLGRSADTSYCRNSGLDHLGVSPGTGVWDAAELLVFRNDSAFFDTSLPPGTYPFTYTVGVDECRRTVSLNLTIDSSALTQPDSIVVCATAEPVDLAPTPGGGVLSGTGVDAAAETFSPAGLPAADYPILYSRLNPDNGCTDTAQWVATVVPEPVGEAGANLSLCRSESSVFLPEEAAGFSVRPEETVVRYRGLGVVDETTGEYRSVNVTAGTTDTVVVTFSHPTATVPCLLSDTLLIAVTDELIADAGPDTSACISQEELLLPTQFGGRWLEQACVSADGRVDLTCLGVTTAELYLVVGAGICEVRDTLRLDVFPDGGVELAANELFLCDTAATVRLPDVTASGPGEWSGDLEVRDGSVDLPAEPAGGYTFVYTVPGLPAACNADSVRLNVAARPDLSVRGDSTLCLGDGPVLLIAEGEADGYGWRAETGATATGDSVRFDLPALGSYGITLDGWRVHPNLNTPYCFAEPVSGTVHILDTPDPGRFTLPRDTVCRGDSLRVAFTGSSQGGREPLRYVLQYDGRIDTVSGSTGVLLPGGRSDSTYILLLTTIGTCGRANDQTTVTVQTAPVVENIFLDYPEPCSGEELELFARVRGRADSITWTGSDGVPIPPVNPVLVNPVTAGEPSSIRYFVNAQNTCGTDNADTLVTVLPASVTAAADVADGTICLTDSARLVNRSTPGADIRYVFDDDVELRGEEIARLFTTPGRKEVIVFADGCGIDTARYSINVLPPPAHRPLFGPTICPGAETEFFVETDAGNIRLYYGDGDSTSQQRSLHTYDFVDSTVLVRYVVTDAEGCTADTSVAVVIDEPVLNGFTQEDERCQTEDGVNFRVFTAPNATVTVLRGERVVSEGFNDFNLVDAGQYSVSVASARGCDTTFTVEVDSLVGLRVQSIGDTAVRLGETVDLTTVSTSLDGLYRWTAIPPPGGISDSSALSPTVFPLEDTEYRLVAMDTLTGCVASESLKITVLDDIEGLVYTPTAFSPNGDGNNDRLMVFPGPNTTLRELHVFNRWGNKLYEYKLEDAAPELIGWDGTFGGKKANQGLHIAKALIERADGERVWYVWEVMLVR